MTSAPEQAAAAGHDEHAHPGLEVRFARDGGTARVTVEISAKELAGARKRELAALARRVNMKGFRRGKVPPALLEKQFGDQAAAGAIEHFAQHAYKKALADGLRPAAFPRIDLGEARPEPGQPFTFEFDLFLRPDVELGEVEGLEVESQKIQVSDEEVERALIDLRRANSRAEPAGDEGLEPEGMAVATLDFFRPGQEEPCLTRENLRISPKTAPGGIDAAAFEQALTGGTVGTSASVEMEFPENFPVEEARGEKGSVRFTLQEVYRIVPPDEEEIRKAFKVETDEALLAEVRSRIEKAKTENEEQRVETELLERVLEAHPMDLPAALIDEQVETHQQKLREEYENQGIEADEAQQRAEAERETGRTQAEKALRAVYLIEEIARAKELQVGEDDMRAELVSIAQRNGTGVEEVVKYYREQNLFRQLGLELLERKVRAFLRSKARITVV
jgi:trigger factor